MARLVSRMFLGILTVLLATAVCFAAPTDEATDEAPVKAVSKKARSKSNRKKLIDINTATADQLTTLPGLGKEDAKKIIAGRPYVRKNQLKQKNIISAATYDGIKKQIVAKKPKK